MSSTEAQGRLLEFKRTPQGRRMINVCSYPRKRVEERDTALAYTDMVVRHRTSSHRQGDGFRKNKEAQSIRKSTLRF